MLDLLLWHGMLAMIVILTIFIIVVFSHGDKRHRQPSVKTLKDHTGVRENPPDDV
ncbi:hypothetical protein ACFO4N_08610 [Camelliibacillus cellulosilyticus]|uniref:Tumor necrosis factor receptor superfamily member 19 n=1 Tax=Camelliibacillus cellulosilyticus TaxID=2174486 RepID=A0ABV9GNN4_9BACL